MSQYDPAKLRALRDNIDEYLQRSNQQDDHVYKALEDSIGRAVADNMKPILDDFKQYIDEKLATPATEPAPESQD